MQILFRILIFILFIQNCCAESDSLRLLKKQVPRFLAGDKNVFYDIIPFLDNHTKFSERIYRQTFETTISNKAWSYILKYSHFQNNGEYSVGDTSVVNFRKFISDNFNSIKFDSLTLLFFVDPFELSASQYRLIQLTTKELNKLSNIDTNEYKVKLYEYPFDSVNSYCLLSLASKFYIDREFYNNFNESIYLNKLRLLTHLNVGINIGNDEFNYDPNYIYSREDLLSYLTYWKLHFQDYVWNSKLRYYENYKEKIIIKTSNYDLIDDLQNKENDTIAISAFLKLANLHPDTLNPILDQILEDNFTRNYSLPLFPKRFLRQLSLLIFYCKQHDIKYDSNVKVNYYIKRLSSEDLSIKQRYELENEIIDRLKLQDITALEYFAIIKSSEFIGVESSLSRIINKLYSKNWETITTNNKELKFYLQKAIYFNDIGIIGACNNYLDRFLYADNEFLKRIEKIKNGTTDSILQNQIKTIFGIVSKASKFDSIFYNNNLEFDTISLLDFKSGVTQKIANHKDEFNWKYGIDTLIEKIQYYQIPEVIKFLRPLQINVQYYDRYEFLSRDFGIEINTKDDFALDSVCKLIISDSIYNIYRNNARQYGLNFETKKQQLDFNKIYSILNFDIVYDIVGGSFVKREDGIYSIIKLLELHFNTTLDFYDKRCNSCTYYCGSTDRAYIWMKYLVEKKLIKNKVKDLSFSFVPSHTKLIDLP
ncbi:MAG TPA: hypothetical protein PK431_14075 [Chitinophagales bacterium]|nr:hypothetical protein [Chitinophagales bacterium]